MLFLLCCDNATDNNSNTEEDKSVQKIELSESSLTIAPFASARLKAVVSPSDAPDSTVTWSSSDESVATVSKGTVTAVKYGHAVITAKAGEKTAECTVTVKDSAAVAGDYEATFWDNASVYFVITDRFYNGNEANDVSYGREKGDPTVQDDVAKFYGGDIAGLTKKLDYLKDLGINAIWITAPYEQIHGWCCGGYKNGVPTFKHYPYHGYYAMDYTNMDANMGTKDEFKTFVDTAHEKGIRIVMDVVMNHPGYNTHEDAKNLFLGVLKPGYENVTLATYHNLIDYNSQDWSLWWSKDWVRAGLGSGDAKYTPGGSSEELKSVNDMPDFKTESTAVVNLPPFLVKKHTAEMAALYPTEGYNVVALEEKADFTVRKYLVHWLSSWVKEFGIDGFRCDTAKHVEKEAWKALKDACITAYNEWKSANPSDPIARENLNFWMTGEHWGHDVSKDAYYTDGGFDSMINFKFRSSVKSALTEINNIDATYKNYVNKINTDSNFNVLSYISSHDTGSDDGKGVFYSAYCNGDKRSQMITAGSLLAMCPGAIQVYYGDEAGREDSKFSTGEDKDQNNRSQMPWKAGEEGYNADLSYEFDSNIHSHWSKVLNFRKNHAAIGAGSHERINTSPYTFKREKGNDKVVVVLGAAAGEVTVDVSSIGASKVKDFYSGAVVDVSGGKATFTVTDTNNGTLLRDGSNSWRCAFFVLQG